MILERCFQSNPAPLRLGLLVALVSLQAGSAAGQARNPAVEAPPSAEATEPVKEMNPFVVEADSDKGWFATQTLAGSRLNTELRNIAAPIEVLTMEFMKDFGLTAFEEATIYTTNVEGFGDNLETGPGLGFSSGFPPPARIRGLGNGTQSRDFFGVTMPTDNYNIERLTVAAGPNNLLFGLGNPAGVIDASLKRAQFRDFRRVEMRFDSNLSQRYAIDVNEELVKGKLAARLSAVHETKEFEYKPSHFDHDRVYGTVQYKPWSKTSISVHYEDVRVENMRPTLLLPFDNITPWYTAGSIPDWPYNGQVADRPIFNNLPISPTAPALGFGNVAALTTTVFDRAPSWAAFIVGPNAGGLQNQLYNLRNTATVKSSRFVPTVAGLSREPDGFTLMDNKYFSDNVNLGGLAKNERIKSKLANVFVTQQVGDSLFFEFAAQRERYLSWNVGMFDYVNAFTLNVDPNRFMWDGVTPNPNLGKLYVEGSPFQTKTTYRSSDWRFTASYEYDFAKKKQGRSSWWREVLGRHRLAGLASRNEEERRVGEYFPKILPSGGLTGADPVFAGGLFASPLAANGTQIANWTTVQSRSITYRYYLNGDVPSPNQDMFKPITFLDSTGRRFTLDMENTGLVDTYGRRLGAGRVTALKRWVNTRQLAYQGFFWDDRLVATIGWRRDETNSGDITNAGNVAHVSGLLPVIEDLGFSFNSANKQTGSTRTRGFILRPLQGFIKLPFEADVALAWNRSNTFQPNIDTVDPFGNRYPGAKGAGEDRGIRLGLWKGRFGFRYTDFENTAGPARAANVPFNRFRFGLAGPINRVKQLAGLTAPLTLYNNNLGFNAGGDGLPYSVMSNQRATGDEYGLDWNVTDNLQIRFNMSRMDVVESQIGRDWFKWMEIEIPKYQALTYPEGGVSTPRDMDGDGKISTWTWNTAWMADSSPRTIADVYQNDVIGQGQQLIESLDGKSNEFVRDSRYNIMASYRFTAGKLKGLSVGGAYRYRAKPLISYGEMILNGLPAIDIEKPYYSKAESLFDLSLNYRGRTDFFKFRAYHVGLNVRNLLDDSDNYVRLRGVDGRPSRMARVAEGRTFVLSIDFELE